MLRSRPRRHPAGIQINPLEETGVWAYLVLDPVAFRIPPGGSTGSPDREPGAGAGVAPTTECEEDEMRGLARLKELLEEIGRIRDKIDLAEKMGVDSAVVDGSSLSLDALREMLAGLEKEVGRAAIADAREEIHRAEEEAGRIRDGKGPKNPAGPGDRDGDGGGDGNGNGGGGNGGGGGGGGGGSSGVPDPVCVYVRSDASVWAWDRREQAWKRFTNGSEIVAVEFVKGGILAVAETGAALFDCGLGSWLTELASTPEELVEGAGEP